MPKVLLVCGQHRGGTSALAGSLYILGGVIGLNIDGHSDAWNERGYFENLDALYANEDLLHMSGVDWDSEKTLPKDMDMDPKYDKVVMRMGEFFSRDMKLAGESFLLVKDPRISLLVPIYLKVFRGLGVEPAFVFCDRSDDEIAASLLKRERFSMEHTVKVTKAHRDSVNRFEDEIDLMWISTFDCLLGHTKQFFEWMKERFELPFEVTDKKIAEVGSFLEAGLRHHASAPSRAIIRDFFRAVPVWASQGAAQ
jgi:hypothetical protein